MRSSEQHPEIARGRRDFVTTSTDEPSSFRPVRRRAHRRPVSDVRAPARRGAALLQRRIRLLRAEPIRRRQQGAGRPRHLQLRPRRDPGADQGQPRDPVGNADLRRPADPRRAPQAAVADVHPAQDRRAGADDPRFLRSIAGSAGGFGPVRLRHRPGRDHADEGHQHAARHSRRRSGIRSAIASTPSCAPRPASP